MRKHIPMALLLNVVFAAFAFAEEVEIPKDLLDALPDEAKFVQQIRAFDKSEHAALAQDREAARAAQSAAGGADLKDKPDQIKAKQDEVTAKLTDARQRLKVLRKAYEKGLEKYPNNAQLQNYYGELLYDNAGDAVGAVKAWLTAVSLDPKLANAWNNLGLHYFHNGDYELGLNHLETALKLDPDNPDYLFNIVQVYAVHYPQIEKIKKQKPKKLYKVMMGYSEKAAKLAPDDFTLQQDYAVNFFAADNFGVKADWKEAAKAWQAARPKARKPDETFYTWLNEARVWLRAGDTDEEVRCLNEALKIRPDSTVAKTLLENAHAGAAKKKE